MSMPEVSAPVTPVELSLWDLGRMEVQREWQRIDIFLLDEQNQLAIIIENKVDTGEHSDQLQRYYETVQQHYPGYKTIGLYLTPSGEVPSHEAYLPLSYGLVCEVLDGLADSQLSVLNADLQTLITHYTGMLRRHIVGNSEIARLSRQIYQKHQRAIDLIVQHRPDLKVETRDLLVELIGNSEELIYKHRHKNDLLFFRPQEWDDVLVFNAGNATAGFFRFVFHNQRDSLLLYLEASPGDDEVRRRLFEMGHKDELLFNYLIDPETDNYPKFYRRTFLTPRFCAEATDAEREAEIRKNWDDFLENDLPRIDAVLKQESWIWQELDESE